jgi:hypothetical protein
LRCPDEVPRARGFLDSGGGPANVDLADELARFVRAFPSWCSRDGEPCCWRHYRLGMTHLGRERSLESLLAFQSAMVANLADPSARQQWVKQQQLILGIGVERGTDSAYPLPD